MTDRGFAPGTGILLMGYGSPSVAADLPAYLTDVLGGRSPSDEVVQEYVRRYALIGGSPQWRILSSLREKLAARAARAGDPIPVFLGTKHWTPHLSEVIPEAVRAGVRRLIAIPLSPYASPWILAPYERGIEEGRRRAPGPVEVEMRSGWHLNRHWLGYWRDAIGASLAGLSAETVVLLSAHSLPERQRTAGDPYPEILQDTVRAIAREAALERWDFSYQSAGNTTEAWLGPDLRERMLDWKRKGCSDQLVAPFGFVFEHLEVLYDLDIVIRDFALENGLSYRRVPMPNDGDRLVEALWDVARAAAPFP